MTSGPHPQPPGWTTALGAAVLGGCAIGWFLISWGVLHTAAGDAASEALGVAFGLLIVVSAVGVIRGRRRDDR